MRRRAIFRRQQHDLIGLDVLRGLAIVLVLVSHFYGSLIPFTAVLFCANGGVILFFFLSGFLMDRIFAQEPKLIPYVARRGFRILPMYWLSIVAIFLLDGRWTIFNVISNALFIAPAVHSPRMSGVYWTLYIEVMFYALVPLLWYLGHRAAALASYLLIAVYAGCWLADIPVSAAPFYVVYCLAGMQIGAWYRKDAPGFAVLASLATIIIGSAVLPIVAPWLGLVPLACASLLWLALRYKVRFALFELFGNVSYSWYLLHPIIGYLAMAAANFLGGWQSITVGVVASFLASAVTFALVEQPFIRFGKVLARQYSARVDAPSPAE
jgi:peptidoglycan/LPS O-acetylase OafA/YrhL